MMSRKVIAAIVAALMLLATLAGCTAPAAPAEGATPAEGAPAEEAASGTAPAESAELTLENGEVVFRFARPEDFKNFDPFNNSDIVNSIMGSLVYDTLLDRDVDGNIVPGLAESYEVSADNTVLTFHLRKGVKFHNGQDFTSADVVSHYGRLLEEGVTLMAKSEFGSIIACEAIDDYTVTITLSAPNGYFVTQLTLPKYGITPHEVYEAEGIEGFAKNIGTGAWKFDSYQPGVALELVRNEDYWGECTSNVDRFIYMPINEDTTRISAVRTGDVDMVDSVTTDQLDILEAEGLEVVKLQSSDQLYIGFQFLDSVFSDYNVRMAFNTAIDRESIVADILGSGRAATFPTGQGGVGFDENYPAIEYSVEKAKEYLAQSSYKGEEIRVIGPIGNYEKIDETLSAVYYMLTEVGFNVKLEQLEGAAFSEARKSGQYDVYIVGASFGSGDGYGFINQRIVGDSLASHYGNEELNNMILDSNSTMDPAERAEKLKAVYTKIMDDAAPMSFILQYQFNYAMHPGISGINFRVDKLIDFNNVQKSY